MNRTIFQHLSAGLALCMALFTAVSCNGPATASDEEMFVQQPSVCMVVGTKEYIGPASGILQISCNEQKHIYRAGIPVVILDQQTGLDVEIVEEYFVVALAGVPGEAGSVVWGDLDLKSSELRNGFQTYNALEFTVKKVEGNLVWLWAVKEHVGVVIQVS